VQSGTSLSQGSRAAALSVPSVTRVPLPSRDAAVDKTLARYEEAMVARPRADGRTARPSRRPSVLGRT
jgi:hypothetical protein